MDLNLAAFLRLELRDLFGNVALEQDGFVTLTSLLLANIRTKLEKYYIGYSNEIIRLLYRLSASSVHLPD
jgi:hypothetical protein